MAYTIQVAEYTLILSGMKGSGTLVGASSAFVTDEDDTNDIFTPSRLQTADIKIIDQGGHEWRNCMRNLAQPSIPIIATLIIAR